MGGGKNLCERVEMHIEARELNALAMEGSHSNN